MIFFHINPIILYNIFYVTVKLIIIIFNFNIDKPIGHSIFFDNNNNYHILNILI